MAATTTKLVTATDTSWTDVTGAQGCIIQALAGSGVVVAVAALVPADDGAGIYLANGKVLDVTPVLQAGDKVWVRAAETQAKISSVALVIS